MKYSLARLTALLTVGTALTLGTGPAHAQATTPAMVAAAQREGKVVFYTSVDVKIAEQVAEAFRAEYPKIKMEVERAGAERVFQRIDQESKANICNADVVNSSDASHFVYWKQKNMLAKHRPPDIQRFNVLYKDLDGYYATWRAHLSVIGYNTKLVPASEAPKSHADLLDPKWKNRLVKAHPGYSGTILTSTYALSKTLGWDYFKKLSEQGVMQVQSSTAPPKSIANGERMVMADGNEYNMFQEIENGSPLKIVYAKEGTPFINSPSAIMKCSKRPNAARVLQNFLFTKKVQQLLVDEGGLRSVHPEVKEKAGRTPLNRIKVIPDNARGMFPLIDDIKKRYSSLFGN